MICFVLLLLLAPGMVPDQKRIEEARNKAKKLMEWEGMLVPDKKGQYPVCLRVELGLSEAVSKKTRNINYI